MRSYEEVIKDLDSKIPRDAVSQREGGGGAKLSYLSSYYVIDRLNKVLGIGNWSYTSEVNLVQAGELPGKYGPVQSVHYIAKVRFVAKVGDIATEFTDYGYGDGTDKVNLGKAHELAVKEAVTDGIKRCAKNLGQSMGLALYDKGQENVDDAQPAPAPSGRAAPGPNPVAVSKAQPVAGSIGPATSKTKGQTAAEAGVDEIITQIGSYSRIALQKKLTTLDDLKDRLKSFGVEKKEELSQPQALELYSFLKGLVDNG